MGLCTLHKYCASCRLTIPEFSGYHCNLQMEGHWKNIDTDSPFQKARVKKSKYFYQETEYQKHYKYKPM